MIARLILITHLAPEVVIRLTPEQSTLLFEEYVAMNSTDDQRADLETFDDRVRPMSAQTEPRFGARLRAELEAKLKNG